MLVDKNAILQIFGSLIKDPALLDNSDNYIFDTTSFTTTFERSIFSAIYNLHKQGARAVSIVDICNYLEGYPSLLVGFEKENGIEYLNDAVELSQPENFNYYYKRFKKFNLLRDLKKMGYDISKIYSEDPSSEKTDQINKRFDELDTEGIIVSIQNDLGILQTQYNRGRPGASMSAAKGMKELITELKEHPEVGTALQGDIFNTVCRGARRGKLYIRSGSSGSGKALPNSTKIPTPNGWTTIGEVKIGDYLFDAFGKPTKVTDIFPQGKKQVYEIEFKDGRKTKCCKEHLWSFNTQAQKSASRLHRKFYTETIEDIINHRNLKTSDGGYNILVPINKAVEYPEKELPISPYLLGLFLGDGSFRIQSNNKAFSFSCKDVELINFIEKETGWVAKKNIANNFTWYFSSNELLMDKANRKNIWVEELLAGIPLLINSYSEEKFIPKEYLLGSIQQRYDLLQGLMDTDGSIDLKGRTSFSTISVDLKDNVIELCQSLGMIVTVNEDRRVDKYLKTGVCYHLSIQTSLEDKLQLFRLPRKIRRVQEEIDKNKRRECREYNPIKSIVALDYEEEMTCFIVDNIEHLFLINDFIVTHNTRNSVGDACFMAYPFRYNPNTYKWETTGQSDKILYISTEQEPAEIQTLIISYLTGFNEEKLLTGTYDAEEEKIIDQAIRLVEIFKDNFTINQIPDPDIAKIKSEIRKSHIESQMHIVFYDYVFSSPALLNEFRDLKIREDVVLMMLTAALKDVAVELNIFIMTSTQLSGEYETKKGIKNQTLLRGAKSIIDKGDLGCIMLPISEEERVMMKEITAKYSIEPNMVTDIYKNRRGTYSNIKIWSYMDLGTCKKIDLFVTNGGYEIINFDIKKYVTNFDFDTSFFDELEKAEVCLKPITKNDVTPTGEIKQSYFKPIIDDDELRF